MRFAAPILFATLALVSACTADGPPDDPAVDPFEPMEPDDCCPDPPLTFFTDGLTVGVGLALDIEYESTFEPDELRLVFADPAVAEARFDRRVLRVVGLAPGRTWLSVQSTHGPEYLAQLDVIVDEVAAIEFHYRPGPVSPGPISQLAGIAGSQDRLRVVYRSADGYVLPGRGTIAVDGSAVEVLDYQAVARPAGEGLDLCWFFPPGAPGESIDLYFDYPGQAELSAELADGRSASIPIEVIPAPAALEAVSMVERDYQLVAADVVDVGEHVVVDVVGRTDVGTLVAGVEADWEADPSIRFCGSRQRTSRAIVKLEEESFFGVDVVARSTDDAALTAKATLWTWGGADNATATEPPP